MYAKYSSEVKDFVDRTKHTVSHAYSPTVARECLHIKCTVGLYAGNPNDLYSIDELKDLYGVNLNGLYSVDEL